MIDYPILDRAGFFDSKNHATYSFLLCQALVLLDEIVRWLKLKCRMWVCQKGFASSNNSLDQFPNLKCLPRSRLDLSLLLTFPGAEAGLLRMVCASRWPEWRQAITELPHLRWRCSHVCLDSKKESDTEMGEAARKEYVLLRRAHYDGPSERHLLFDTLPHCGDVRSLLCFWVSSSSSLACLLACFIHQTGIH